MSDLPEDLEGTGVFATEVEIERLRALAKAASQTPVILLFGKHDLAGDAWEKARKATHEAALEHGLPEIEGYYGMAEDGEFLRMKADG